MSGNSEKITVLFTVGSMHIGGAETVIANLCRHLDRRLFNVSVYYIKWMGDIGKELLDEGFKVTGGVEGQRPGFLKYLRFSKLKRAIEQDRIDILHSHDLAALTDGSQCRMLSPGLKFVHTFHFGNYPHISRSAHLLQKIFWRVPDRLISVGIEQKAAILKTFGIPDARIQTIWNGVEEKKSEIDELFGKMFRPQGKIVIGSISSLSTQKGLTYLLDTAHALKKRTNNFIFVIAGDGPLRGELEQKARDLGLQDTVFFTGWVKNASSRLMPLFDIFYQPSLWEAMSVVVIEAMAASKPVVATRVGENMHVVQDGKSGFIVKPKNTEEAVSALLKLVSDRDLRERFGREGRNFYKNRCLVDHMAMEYEQLYMSLRPDKCKLLSSQAEQKGVYEPAS